MSFWDYFKFLLILFLDDRRIKAEKSYTLYPEEVSWMQALEKCRANSYQLVVFDPSPLFHVRSIPSVKRQIYRSANESWVGDYISYEVLNGNQLNTTDGLFCVHLNVKRKEKLGERLYCYGYAFSKGNCSHSYNTICKDRNSDINISEERESWSGSCQNGQLWMPTFTVYQTAVSEEFALGNYTTSVEGLEVGKTYWIGYCLREFASTVPVRQNIFRCGYLSIHEPAILYDECNFKRSYVCEDGIGVEKQESSSSAVLYVGLGGSIIIFIIVCVLLIVLCRRKQRIYFQNKMSRQGDTLASLNFPKENQTHQRHQINRGTNNQTCKGTESNEASDKIKETYLTLDADSTYDCIDDSSKYYEVDVFKNEESLTDSGQNVTRTEQEDSGGEAIHKHNENKSDNEYEPLDNTDITHMYSAIDTGDQTSDSVDQSE